MAVDQILLALQKLGEPRPSLDLSSVLLELSEAAGMPFMCMRNHSSQGSEEDAVMASHWPEGWLQHYSRSRYAGMDPLLRYLQICPFPFRWGEALSFFQGDPHYRGMERMMKDAAYQGLQDGYVFPIHGKGGLLAYGLIAGDPVELSNLEIVLVDAGFRAAYWQVLRHETGRQPGQENARTSLEITPREREVLMHLADGLTSNEISKILSISRHTVDWYMGGLQAKFGARNRQHALAIAFRNGTIS